MADLTEIQAAQAVKVVGSDNTGVEQTPVQSTANGALHTNLRNDAGTEIATASNPLRTDPTGTTTQPVSGIVTAKIQDSFGGSLSSNAGSLFIVGGDVSGISNSQRVLTVQGAGIGSVPHVVNVSQSTLPTGAATETTLAALNTKVTAVNTGAVTISTALPTGANSIGTVAVSNFPASQAVTGTFFQATQPVSIASMPSTPVTGPLTDTQLRLTAVPISGTVSANATLSAETTKVIGTVNMAAGQTIAVTGTFFQATQPISAVSLPLPTGAATESTQSAMSAKLPAVLGARTIAQSMGVNIASDQIVPISGTVSAIPVDGNKTSYSVAITNLVPVATPTDIFTITGSATKTIRVTRIALNATQTTAANRDVLLLRRSTANTAGTSTAPTRVSHDSTNAAATATVLAYTANPTLGTLVGAIRTRKVFISTTATNPDEVVLDFGIRPAQAIVLRGVGEVLSINLNSISSAGNLFNISIEWSEE